MLKAFQGDQLIDNQCASVEFYRYCYYPTSKRPEIWSTIAAFLGALIGRTRSGLGLEIGPGIFGPDRPIHQANCERGVQVGLVNHKPLLGMD